MVDIDVKLDDRAFKEMKKAQKKYGEKVIKRAKRDAARKARTALQKEISKKYNIKQNESKKFISTTEDSLCVESKKLTVGTDTHFSITPKKYVTQKDIPVKKRKRATTTIMRGNKKKFSHGFILNPAKVKNGAKVMLWKRNGKQEPEPVKSLSVAEMANNKEIAENTQRVMSETFEKRLNHHIDREMSKIANH